jgi:FkbM family methyltransferase
MKRLIKSAFQNLGYDVQRINVPPPGSKYRPLGDFAMFLDDVRARGLAPTVILDVGANVGDWTRMALAVFPTAQFLLIEPQFETRESLDRVCSEFPNVSWVLAAAGAANDHRYLNVGGDLGVSSFFPRVDEAVVQAGKQRQVEIITVDNLLKSRGMRAPELVKMDIQGFEIEALKGSQTLFGKTELFVLEASLYPFYETMPIVSELVAFMHTRGYELYDIPGYFRRPLDGAVGQLDLAFARQDGVLRRSNRWD